MKGQGKRWSKNEFARDGWGGVSLRAVEPVSDEKRARSVPPQGLAQIALRSGSEGG